MDCQSRSIFAALPRTTRGMPLVISGDPKGKNFLYCNGNSVIIRDIQNPAISDVYTEHSTTVYVAKYSPSGFYIASGDKSGKVRIWDTTQKEHILKKEYQPLGNAIHDLSWSSDNQRIAVVGEGRDRFGHVFLFETGTSNGNLSGQTKTINSVDFRPVKPYRLVTASEDTSTAIFEGPPFKFKTHSYSHSRFAQCVRYAPSGNLFACCGADGKVFLYDGLEGTPTKELIDSACNSSAHKGGAYALSWSPDGTQLLTASADGTCKIWDVEKSSLITTFVVGSSIEDQQLGCLWQDQYLLSVSLSGCINYLDPADPKKPRMVIKGHNKPLTCVSVDRKQDGFYTADMEGGIVFWDRNRADAEFVQPKWHKAQIQSMALQNDTLLTIGIDDTLTFAKPSTDGLWTPKTVKLDSQPRGVAHSEQSDIVAVVTVNQILLYKDGPQLKESISYEGTCIAMHPTENLIAVGGSDSKVRLYEISTSALKLVKEATHMGSLTCARFSPDGQYLAVGDSARRIVVYCGKTLEPALDREWSYHTARVNCLAWSPEGRYLASGSLDTNIILWDVQNPSEHLFTVKGAHRMNQITGIEWMDDSTIVSVGQDAMVRQWDVKF